jgi:hypothetical protein
MNTSPQSPQEAYASIVGSNSATMVIIGARVFEK